MDFALSPKAAEYAKKLQAFMDREVFPAESIYHQQRLAFVKAGTPHKLPPVVEELKKKAKAAGLWNLFVPKDHGGELTNLEYAPLALAVVMQAIVGLADEAEDAPPGEPEAAEA